VEYEGTVGVKVRGKKAHSVSAGQVAQLVEEFYKIDFFSLSDSYDDHTIDHYNPVTIGLLVGERKKSIWYHVIFTALLIPLAIMGGKLVTTT
jgi:hypothetical protein